MHFFKIIEINSVSKNFRFPVGTGIAGFVAETGETLNVHDAYKDPRFNATIDEQVSHFFLDKFGQVWTNLENLNSFHDFFFIFRLAIQREVSYACPFA